MKRTIIFFVALVLSLSATALAQDVNVVTVETPTDIPSFVGYVENEFIIVFKRGVGPVTVARSPEGVPTIGVPDFDAIARAYGVSRIKKQFRGARSEELACYYKVKFTIGTREQAMAAYRNHPLVDHVEPIGIHTMFLVPNDPYYSPDQWHLNQSNDHDIDAPEAWNIETGSETVTVAILDSGVRYFHKDLGGLNASSNPTAADGNMWINWAEKNGTDDVDDDGNLFVDDWIGWDFVNAGTGPFDYCWISGGEDCTVPDNDPRDFNGHGTHCSGIASAITNNNTGVAAIAGGDNQGNGEPTANGAKIMALRIGWEADHPLYGHVGMVRMDFAAEAFDYAAANGARIASCSWGSSNSGGLGAAVDNFTDPAGHGGLVLAAAGNSNNESQHYLCTRPDVISVAATNRYDCKASFSSFGDWVDISAPGVDILSLAHQWPAPQMDGYAWASGTSMASPLAAGVAALIWSKEYTWTAAQVKQQLYDTADNIYGLSCNSNYIGKLGAGRVNAYAAVCRPQADFTADPTSGCAPLTVNFTDQSTGEITGWFWDFNGDDIADSTVQNPTYEYQDAGTYTVTLTVTGDRSDSETKTDYITVSAVPVADFSANPTTGCAPLTVNFTDLSSNNPTSWSWDFNGDDVADSTVQNPTYVYQDAGTYTVTLTASNTSGSDVETKLDYVQVDPPCGTTKAFALSDIPVKGTMSGSYLDTHASDDVYEVITEVESGGKPSKRYSMLEHKWDFNVTPGGTIRFVVEAFRLNNSDGDDFLFEYSTDGIIYESLGIVVNSDVEQTYFATLPNTVSGNVYIRVVDTNRIPGQRSLDRVHINCMYIESQGESQLTIITNSLPSGTVDIFYSETLQATGGTLPYTWTITDGSLPGGLSLNEDTGEISGTPTTEQTSDFTVQVTDSDAATDSKLLSINISAADGAPVIVSCSPAFGGQNQRLSVTIDGQNFQAGATVSFEDITVQTTSVNSSSEIVCRIKIGNKAAPGPRNVTVMNPDGQSGTLTGGFTVQ